MMRSLLRPVFCVTMCLHPDSPAPQQLFLLHTAHPPLHTPPPSSSPHTSSLLLSTHLQGWVSEASPGSLDTRSGHLRDCISVLFMFERRPTRDKSFSEDCRQWLNLLVSKWEIINTGMDVLSSERASCSDLHTYIHTYIHT